MPVAGVVAAYIHNAAMLRIGPHCTKCCTDIAGWTAVVAGALPVTMK